MVPPQLGDAVDVDALGLLFSFFLGSKKRKVLLIGFGVLLVGGISYFILKKK